MKIRMELLSDAIFGNGMSIPGGEDISVLKDAQGFPYFKGIRLRVYSEKNCSVIMSGRENQIQRKKLRYFLDLAEMITF